MDKLSPISAVGITGIALPLTAVLVLSATLAQMGILSALSRGEREVSKCTTPDFSSVALITIDMQQDTLDNQPLEVPGTSAKLPTLMRLLESFREAEKPIIHLVRIYQPDGSNVDLCRREQVEQGAQLVLAGSPGCEIASELLSDQESRLQTEVLLAGQIQRVGPHEVIIYKPRWGGFLQNTPRNLLTTAAALHLTVHRLQLPQLSSNVDLRGKRTRFSCSSGRRCRFGAL